MTAAPPPPPATHNPLLAAVEHHRAGRLAEAMRLYRLVLVHMPAQPDALHLLGIASASLPGAEGVATGLRWVVRALVADPASGAIVENAHRLALRDRRELTELLAARRPAGRRRSGPRSVRVLHLGVKPLGHDAALFAIDPQRRDLFGLSSERTSRFKHDSVAPIGPLLALIEEWGIDPGSVERLKVGYAAIGQELDTATVDANRLDARVLMRWFLGTAYSGDYGPAEAAFLARPEADRRRRLLVCPDGRQALERLSHSEEIQPEAYYTGHLARLFPNARITADIHDHHLCHAISSYVSAPIPEGLLITMDGFGNDRVFSRAYRAAPGGLNELATSRMPSWDVDFGGDGPPARQATSPGCLYSWFTARLGFTPTSDEGKVEALAAYGEPIPDLLAAMKAAMPLDPGRHALVPDEPALVRLLEVPAFARRLDRHGPEAMAATAQRFLEDVTLDYVRHLVALTGERRLMLSGGVFANVILNLRIFEEIGRDIHIVPAMADDGTAQGAACLTLLDGGGRPDDLAWMKERRMPFFGTACTDAEIDAALDRFAGRIRATPRHPGWPERAAERIATGEVGAIVHGRMEWGPRALGNRSILADPRPAGMRERINREIKRRPAFQPFCPAILIEEKDRLFEAAYDNRHMTCAFRLKPEFHAALPGAAHVDGTARAQFVHPDEAPAFWRLIARLRDLTGFGVVINTSFNRHGRTIVENAEDALTDFLDTDLDFLCLEGRFIERAR